MATSIEDCLLRSSRSPERPVEIHEDGNRGLCPGILYLKEIYEKGELGRIQFLQASHQQDMDGWAQLLARSAADVVRHPLRWPDVALTRATAEYVSCFGSGTIPPGAHQQLQLALRRGDNPHQFKKLGFAAVSIAPFLMSPANTESIDVTAPRNPSNDPDEHEPHVDTNRKLPERKIPKKIRIPDYRPAVAQAHSSVHHQGSMTWARRRT